MHFIELEGRGAEQDIGEDKNAHATCLQSAEVPTTN